MLSTLSPQINAAPSLTPTVLDPTAPDSQQCPGYKASNVVNTTQGFTAELTIAGANCQAFGNDVADLTLEVSYQAKGRLNVRIYPKYIAPQNSTQYILPANLVEQPTADGKTTEASSDLKLEWSNEPTFQFRVLRQGTGEELFSTYGHVIVFEDQFIELVTNMVTVSDKAGKNGINRYLISIFRDIRFTGSLKTRTTSCSATTILRPTMLPTRATQSMVTVTASILSIRRPGTMMAARQLRTAYTLVTVRGSSCHRDL